jgi:replication factor A1
MIQMPLEQAISKIKEASGLSEEEIKGKIDAKLDQLSGLVSKEGAAYIIANELGVKLFEQTSGKLQIKNILTGMRDVETVGKVTRKFEVREFQRKDGNTSKVGSFMIGDETGIIKIVCWGSQADELAKFNEGDIVQVSSGYIRENNNYKEIHLNDKSKLNINPEGVTITVAEASSIERPAATRIKINELKEDSNNVELMGTIVQSFEPRFFEVDPVSGKRVRAEDGVFKNANGETVTPDYSYVMNAVLDDGTETVRTVFFRQQVEQLLGKNKEEVLSFKDNLPSFESVKTELLGKQILVSGRASKNTMFDRIEFVTNNVTNPDPSKEIEKIEGSEQ